MKKLGCLLALASVLTILVFGLTACSKANSIAFASETYTIYLDGETTVTPEVNTKPKNCEYTLSVSNATICTVSEDGKSITGLKEGITVLTATSGEKTATANVTVYKTADSPLIPPDNDGKFSVTFVTSQGSVAAQRVSPNGYATYPEDPDFPDEKIENWYTDEEFTTVFNFETTPITADITLYAKWTADDTLTFIFTKFADGTYCVGGFKYPALKFTSVTIPSEDGDGNVITCINSSAFAQYAYLEEVIIPASIKTIKDKAFAGCGALKTVTFEGDSELITVEEQAFSDCGALTTIALPNTVSKLGSGAFLKCKVLNLQSLPTALDTLESEVLRETATAKLDLSNVKTIGTKALYNTAALTTVTNASRVTSVEQYAFSGTAWIDSAADEYGVTYLNTILIYAKASPTKNDITVREDTTVIAAYSLKHLTNVIIRLNSATPPERKDYAIDIANYSSDVHYANTVNIVVPEAYYSAYLTAWGTSRTRQIYYAKTLTEGEGGTLVSYKFFVRTLNGLKSVVLDKCEGGAASVMNISGVLANEFGAEGYYLERIKAYAIYKYTTLTTLNLPVRLGSVEDRAVSACARLATINLSGYFDADKDPVNNTKVTSLSFYNLANAFIINVPSGRDYTSSSSWSFYYTNNHVGVL